MTEAVSVVRNETKNEKKRRIYRERRRLKICVRSDCGKPQFKGYSHCEEHYYIDQANQRAAKAKMKRKREKEEKAETDKNAGSPFYGGQQEEIRHIEQQQDRLDILEEIQPQEPEIKLADTVQEAEQDWLDSVQDGTPSRVMRAKREHFAKMAGILI